MYDRNFEPSPDNPRPVPDAVDYDELAREAQQAWMDTIGYSELTDDAKVEVVEFVGDVADPLVMEAWRKAARAAVTSYDAQLTAEADRQAAQLVEGAQAPAQPAGGAFPFGAPTVPADSAIAAAARERPTSVADWTQDDWDAVQAEKARAAENPADAYQKALAIEQGQ